MKLLALQKEIRDKTFAYNITIMSMFISLKKKKKIMNTETLTDKKFLQL